MKIIFLFLILSGFCFAQLNSSLQNEIQAIINSGGKVALVNNNELLVEYQGLSRKFYLGRAEAGQNEPVDTTFINVLEIDTTQYNKMFSFWQRVEIFNSPLFVDDLNGNGKPEIYGSNKENNQLFGGPVRIFEMDNYGEYKLLTMFNDSSTLGVIAFANIDSKGEKDLYIGYLNTSSGVFFVSDSLNMLPTKYHGLFSYNTNSQINNMTFGDFDNNGITDCIFSVDDIIIGEYRDSIQNFSFIFSKIIVWDISRFAIADFDEDGKTEFIYANTHGVIKAIEAVGINNYENSLWEGNLGIPNAYISTVTDDIDGNGKKEFWIGGQDLASDTTKIVIKCFESNDNNYHEKAVIILPFIYSLTIFEMWANDLDDDGTEELIIQFASNILVLKFTGSINNHNYKVVYVKLQEGTQPGANFYAVQIADLNLDGEKDILLPMFNYNAQLKLFSYILTQNGPTNIKEENKGRQEKDFLITYPNPFNLSTNIKYRILEGGVVKINVFNIMGEETALLKEEYISPGEYEINWEAKDKYGDSLPSGIYFIFMQINNSIQITKTILLK